MNIAFKAVLLSLLSTVALLAQTSADARCDWARTSNLLPSNCYDAPGGLARHGIVPPFSYTLSQSSSDNFPVKIGPLRYTVWSHVPPSEKPSSGWLQNVVDGFLRHYTSNPVVPANERCLRSLSCNSLYEQALRRKAVTSWIR